MTARADIDEPWPDAVVRYADHRDATVDLHVPAGSADTLVVLLHGGFWRSGWDRRHTRPVADALRAAGHLVATPEYRRTGARGEAAGGWPATFEDVRTAVSSLPRLVESVGLPVPPSTYVVGHSAGGHLALWLATEGVHADRVVALAPVGDLADAYRRDLDDGAVAALLGGSPTEVPERYAATDPAVLLRGGPGGAGRIVVLHGTADDRVPLANSDWARGLAHVDLRILDGVDHFALMEPGTAAFGEVLRALSDR